MYIIRDIFQLKFGHYKEVKAILEANITLYSLIRNNKLHCITNSGIIN